MKFRYKPPYNNEIIEFDPGNEIVCPLCGAIKPVPYGWKTHLTSVTCTEKEKHATRPEFYHNALFFDINTLLGDDLGQIEYMIREGIIYEKDLDEWCEKRTLWHTMYAVGSVPEWKVEPDPFWRRTLKEAISQHEDKRG